MRSISILLDFLIILITLMMRGRVLICGTGTIFPRLFPPLHRHAIVCVIFIFARGREHIRDCFVDHEFRKFLNSSVRGYTLQRNPYQLIKGVIGARYDV